MKTVIISLLAIATSLCSFANQPNEISCPVDCPTQKPMILAGNTPVFSETTSTITSGTTESFSTKLARIEDAYENQQGYLNFQHTISAALNKVETERHLMAVEDLKSYSAFSTTITSAFRQIEAGKHAVAYENALATEQFNNLMEKALINSSGI